MGWMEFGGEGNPNARTCRPRKLGLPILGRRECLKSGIKPINYHVETGCLGIIGSNSIICNNDAGTAILRRSYSGFYSLIGILSDINNCSNKQGTAVYLKIGPYLNWIYKETKDSCYCFKPFVMPDIKSSHLSAY
ncbi:PREDICTED: transmembrane protease serine 11A-like [Ceratosolen solmsi marchali]|uniref:Transmembrane protease serine 11A-like n=1 Tax=Ceratosolen solmsi marchali TaxID=326594 RepID=A0AAJ6YHG8_9HYME|nr:PREDICTED: transmembrane protease serine 11A-like [Ceratosolen solmsi marchali]